MKYIRFFAVLPFLLLAFAGCKVSDTPTNTGGDANMITTTISGVVNDEAGQPIAGVAVTITVNGVVKNSATTNKYGSFMIQNASVPSSRCLVLCKKSGYFTGSRAETPKAGNITEMRLTMQSNTTTHTVNAISGGKITIGSASVNFPANAFVTSTGAPYTGTVNIAAKYLDPTKPTFYNSFAGDMTATRTDGSQTELLSYGVLRVLIKDAAGNELKLASGKTATLTYPLAASIQKNAPASMPLWYFDETLGMWKEEGTATKSGTDYIGEVAHFSEWNCDDPTKTGTVKGRIVCNGTDGVSGVYVTVGQRKVMTDSNGSFSCRAPINTDFVISVNPIENSGLTAGDTPVTALTSGEVRILADIQLTVCPATVIGTIVDCNASPTAGTVIVSLNGSYIYNFTSSGKFKIRVPAGFAFNVDVTTLDGKLGLSVSAPALNSGDSYDAGQITACDNGSSAEFYDIDYGSGQSYGALLSPDGSLVAITGSRGNTNFTEIYDVKTNTKISGVTNSASTLFSNFSADGSRILIRWGEDSMCVMNTQTGAILQKIATKNGKILPDGSSVVALVGYEPSRLAVFSVATGLKIKDLSYSGSPFYIAGFLGANQIQIVDNNSYIGHFVTWDMNSDAKVNETSIPNAISFSFPYGLSPNCSLVAFIAKDNMGTINFYNSESGAKINASPFTIPGGYSPQRQETISIGVANDNSFVLQHIFPDSIHPFYPPTIYSIPDGKLKKVLSIQSQSAQFTRFSFNDDSRYLVGIPITLSSSVRVWKLK